MLAEKLLPREPTSPGLSIVCVPVSPCVGVRTSCALGEPPLIAVSGENQVSQQGNLQVSPEVYPPHKDHFINGHW